MALVNAEFALQNLNKVISVQSNRGPLNIEIRGFTKSESDPIIMSPAKFLVYDIMVNDYKKKKTRIIRN